ncbi:hypothetical protein BELL_1267g00010 [Botrytis elliptica]|uniref:Uncharacterized protein n=1 Tax=Botrytis elliptica TaxID=278938 RepID=A0A4Z1IC08_9HELO|nr:hypothetical protein BELL_1267g00010 [Botrytis elliptica]
MAKWTDYFIIDLELSTRSIPVPMGISNTIRARPLSSLYHCEKPSSDFDKVTVDSPFCLSPYD